MGMRSPDARIPKRDMPKCRHIGCIKVKGRGMLNLPRNKWPVGKQQLCDACMNENPDGYRNPICTKSHDPVDLWPKVVFELVNDHVKKKTKHTWVKETLKNCLKDKVNKKKVQDSDEDSE